MSTRLLRSWWYFALRHRWVRHGHNVNVQLGCFFGGRARRISLGNNVGIGFNCLFLCECRIGNDVLIASNCHFVNRSDHRIDAVGVTVYSSGAGELHGIVVEDDVWIGQSAVLLAPVTVGRGAVIAAGAIVVHDVMPYSIVAGNPAKVVRMRFTPEQIVEHERLLLGK